MDATISCADRVYAHVRDAILTRQIPDNTLLAEGRLAEQTGVSRTPVREALLRLESEGMVRLLPKRGALVLPVTAAEARDVLETRALVETHCVAKVIDTDQGDSLASAMDAAIDHMQAAAAAQDVHAYVSADREFHAAIVAAAGNGILTKLYESLRDRQLRMGATNLLGAGGHANARRIAETIGEHREIARAICSGARERALSLTRSHLATAERYLAR